MSLIDKMNSFMFESGSSPDVEQLLSISLGHMQSDCDVAVNQIQAAYGELFASLDTQAVTHSVRAPIQSFEEPMKVVSSEQQPLVYPTPVMPPKQAMVEDIAEQQSNQLPHMTPPTPVSSDRTTSFTETPHDPTTDLTIDQIRSTIAQAYTTTDQSSSFDRGAA